MNGAIPPNGWWSASEPDNFSSVPWLHPAVILYMESLLRPTMTVIEHGCGGSTLWFAERVAHVYSVDVSDKWLEAVKARANSAVTLIHSPIPVSILPKADLLLIDGPSSCRLQWIAKASQMVVKGGIIIVDNFNRDEYREAIIQLKKEMQHYIEFWTSPPGHKDANTVFFRMRGGQLWI